MTQTKNLKKICPRCKKPALSLVECRFCGYNKIKKEYGFIGNEKENPR